MADNVVLGKVANLEACLARIRDEYDGHEAELETNLTRQDAIVLNLQRACQTSIDLAHHLVRIRGLGLPTDSREPFQMLQQASLLPPELAQRLQRMVGFRNIAVHRYHELDVKILRMILEQRLSDFREMAAIALRLP